MNPIIVNVLFALGSIIFRKTSGFNGKQITMSKYATKSGKLTE